MEKAQVFLTEEQKTQLKSLAAKTGRKQSEIIRHGVDLAIAEAQQQSHNWKAALKRTKGIWKDREDVEERIAQNRQRWRRRSEYP